jgi:GMP synthase-like glutamine amidotransferase
MIVIVDNGKGAGEISMTLRAKTSIVKPKEIPPKAAAYILSDGALNKDSQKLIAKFLGSATKPVLGIGVGQHYIASAFGAGVKEKPPLKQNRISIKKPCPLLLDLKRIFTVVDDCKYAVENLPENFSVAASSPKNEFEVIQELEKPFFGVHFNPELGMEGRKILDNFAHFAEMWEKYHK